jgi:hypothetical protein
MQKSGCFLGIKCSGALIFQVFKQKLFIKKMPDNIVAIGENQQTK